MAKIKLTKGELKKQRDGLKQFRRYLPTLQLKKQQLQIKILDARKQFEHHLENYLDKDEEIRKWHKLLADADFDIGSWIIPKEIKTTTANIAGAIVPAFDSISFEEAQYDFYLMPFWLDKAILALRELMQLLVQVELAKLEIRILEKELRTTTQRVNLFEKVKIPECLENIRKIRIYLGDQMANAVGVSKVAKKKVEIKSLVEAFV